MGFLTATVRSLHLISHFVTASPQGESALHTLHCPLLEGKPFANKKQLAASQLFFILPVPGEIALIGKRNPAIGRYRLGSDGLYFNLRLIVMPLHDYLPFLCKMAQHLLFTARWPATAA